MAYNISEILALPVEEQKAIATAILEHIDIKKPNPNHLTQQIETMLDKRFANVESGNYKSYSLAEVKQKLEETLRRKLG